MLRTLLIDDEAHNRDTLRKLLVSLCPQVYVVGEATSVVSGIREIRKHKPDLVFLDMNLNDGTAFDLIHDLRPINFKIIFISAFDSETLRAVRLSDLAYLTKPVNPNELISAVNRENGSSAENLPLKLEVFRKNMRKKQP